MRSVCFYFHIHQPFRLKRYRFFDIGNDHYYFDDFTNDDIITRLAETSYIPMCDTLLDIIRTSNGGFKCAIGLSGTAVEQMQLYVPELIDRLKALADTGCVEFLSGTYAHSLSSLESPEEFRREVYKHDEMIRNLFGKTPETFANTELIYDDDIAGEVLSMGFRNCITVGAKHIMGWKSPNYLYQSETAPDLRLLITNDKLADDVARNFNNPSWPAYPLTADKYMDWIAAFPEQEQIVNLYFPMDVFGSFLPANTGIFQFMKALPQFAAERGIRFVTPSEAVSMLKPVGMLSQKERVSLCDDRQLKQDWEYLQSSDHFFYMSTKNMADGASHAAFSPYDSPFSAFINYMNVLADFLVRVEEQYPDGIDNEELNSLLLTIRNQAAEITSLNKEVKSLRSSINPDDEDLPAEKPAPVKKRATKKAPAKKTATRKAEQ